MALPVYIEIQGTKQGKFTGGCKRKGREGMIEGIQLDHEIEVPTDKVTGQATGNRVHGPLFFLKEIDRSSPMLLQALVTNEQIKEMVIHFWKVNEKGQELEFYTVKLSDGALISVNTMLPNINKEGQLKPSEEVGIRYSKIEWTITDGNIVAMDDWYEPARA